MKPDSDADLIDAWLRFKQFNQGKAEGTVVKYRGYLSRLAAFLETRGETLLTADLALIEVFTGLHSHQEGLSPISRRAVVAAVKGFYAWAKRTGVRADDPASGVPYPVSGRKIPTALETKHAQALLRQQDLDTFQGVRDLAILMTLIGCGLRVSGLVGLNESSLYLYEVNGVEWMGLKVTEKGKRERLVPAPEIVKYIIHAYLGHRDLAGIDRTLPNGDRVLFVSTMNRAIEPQDYHGEARRISARSIHDMIQKYGKQAGIPAGQMHAHAMRHLYGTELAEHGADLLMRQALMGHEQPKTTEIYTRMALRRLTEVVEAADPFKNIETPLSDLVRELKRRKG